MQQPIGQSGRVRLSPLMSAVASSKSSVTAGGGPINASGNSGTGVAALSANALPPSANPQAIAAAQEQAAQGDQQAIDWLKAAGIATGVAATAGGAYAISRALGNRNKKTLPRNFGASDVATKAQAPNAASATSKAIPHVTQLRDEVHLPPVELLPEQMPANALRKAASAVRRLR